MARRCSRDYTSLHAVVYVYLTVMYLRQRAYAGERGGDGDSGCPWLIILCYGAYAYNLRFVYSLYCAIFSFVSQMHINYGYRRPVE